MTDSSVGIVATKVLRLEREVRLDSGHVLPCVDVAYETYGQLAPDGSNAILILHALSGDAHAAGRHAPDDEKTGWWEIMIGPGKPIDTNKFFVIASNSIGGCKGTTGPSSIDPRTGAPYGSSFPVITIHDMVRVQKLFLEQLGIDRLHAVIGGSMGGQQVIEWAVRYPTAVKKAIPIASTAKLSAQGIAFHEVGRRAIMLDPNFSGGDYYDRTPPVPGLSIARMVGHITYLSEEAMNKKFGRRLQDRDSLGFAFDAEFQVESYLRYQGNVFTKRFDANSYLIVTKAIDYYDLEREFGSLEAAFGQTQAQFLVISFTSDWLFPSAQSRDIVKALAASRKHVTYCEIEAEAGHDSFLLPNPLQEQMIGRFLTA